MKPPIATKKLTTLSLLSAIALALYAVESALPPIVPIPGIKLGLANIITLVVLWKYSGNRRIRSKQPLYSTGGEHECRENV